jgi:hypothetical protein
MLDVRICGGIGSAMPNRCRAMRSLCPPNTPDPITAHMRAAFADMWRGKNFLTAYVNLIKTQPIMIDAEEGDVLADLAQVPSDIKTFTAKYIANMTAK